jgi:hypothetical protein
MKNYFKSETFTAIISSIVFSLLIIIAILWATAPEQWYAGMHTQDCNGSANCGCYEKLIEIDKNR